MQMPYEMEPRAFLNVQNVIRNIAYYISVWALQCLASCLVNADFYAGRPAMEKRPIWLPSVERGLEAAAPESGARGSPCVTKGWRGAALEKAMLVAQCP